MEYVQWETKYETQIALIDSQHRMLFNLINELYNAMKLGKSNTVLSEILTELINYTDYHFKAEEELMEEYQYFDLEQHKKEHKSFVQKVLFFYQRYIADEAALSIEILEFLTDWLSEHILIKDQKFAKTITDSL